MYYMIDRGKRGEKTGNKGYKSKKIHRKLSI
jgi:hypothetical protein